MNDKRQWSAEGKPIVTKSLAEYASDAADNGKGLECPGCGCRDFRVKDTYPMVNAIKRVRVCRNCGKRVPTRERIVGEKPEQRESD